MPEIKWRRLDKHQYHCVLRFIVFSYSQNGFSKDFLRYESDPGGFLVALVIRRCVNATEATMEAARLAGKMGNFTGVVGHHPVLCSRWPMAVYNQHQMLKICSVLTGVLRLVRLLKASFSKEKSFTLLLGG